MTKNLKTLLFGCALLCASNLFGATPAPLKVSDIKVDVNEKAETFTLQVDLNMKDYKLGKSAEMIFTPVVLSQNGNDSIVMQPFTVCGRSRYYYYMRENMIGKDDYRIYRAGSKEPVRIKETMPLQDWMTRNSTVEIRQMAATCCSEPTLVPGDLPNGNLLLARIHPSLPNMDFDYVFAPPMEDKPVEKVEEGKAFVTFVVNRTELNPTYMNNPAEIQKILNSIDVVKNDPDAIIKEIHIRGFASPEGPYWNNVRLAQGRTETLANYVNSLYKFGPGIMTTSYMPEDWEGLRTYVADSMNYNLTNRQGLLNIINGTLEYDARDAALKREFPQDYQVILKEIYPWLRHSDYAVKYNIKVYTDLKDLMRLYNTDPTKLRPVDFYTIAQQYPTGSPQYNEVMLKAVEVYPMDPMLNLNAANIYMKDGKLTEAQTALYRSGNSPEADYARGVFAAKCSNYKEAANYFKLAKQAGISQAAQYLEQIEKAADYSPVEIVVPTSGK